MGFLTIGNTFSWDEASEKPIEYVKKHGVVQFLNIYNREKDRTRDKLRWGDEVEYIIVHVDKQKQLASLSLRAPEIIEHLSKDEREGQVSEHLWRPEYARYMVEGTPGNPYGDNGVEDCVKIERSLIQRRQAVLKVLYKQENVVSMTNFPLLGASQFGPYTVPHFAPGGAVAQSVFTPDEVIHPHFRFSTLTANIRERRGSKVDIKIPLYRDKFTPSVPLPIPPSLNGNFPNSEQEPFTIYLDSMAAGMGACCLQTTFQCCNIKEARYLYDQLGVLAPILISFSAASPIYRGYLSDIDTRWNVISASVDDRTEEERGLKPLKNSKFVIPKSRYGSISTFIAQDPRLRTEYNDIPLVYDQEIYEQLLNGGVDSILSKHIAHLWIRDPLVIYRDKLKIDDETHSDHFENIQSTNWQSMRFKPPPPGSNIGWRIEVRPMDIQLSDFENAAFCVFTVLLTRIIIVFNLNFYIPISLVDKNIETAHITDSIKTQSFYFRKIVNKSTPPNQKVEDEYTKMTINEIINGSKEFIGLIPLIEMYLDTVNLKKDSKEMIMNYLNFLKKRASGELMTGAAYIRKLVKEHPDYKFDSVVTPKINFDLVHKIIHIGRGECWPPELFGEFRGLHADFTVF